LKLIIIYADISLNLTIERDNRTLLNKNMNATDIVITAPAEFYEFSNYETDQIIDNIVLPNKKLSVDYKLKVTKIPGKEIPRVEYYICSDDKTDETK